jgi:hypothetical protein
MVDRLTPEILRLRGESSAPITVYIDSPGGGTYHARLLIRLITGINQDGQWCRMITVVTGIAASAAADILAAGHYAIAYSHSLILYHGVRTNLEDITHESASTLVESLKQSNESFALELAERIKRRFFFIYTQLSSDFPAVRNGDVDMSTVECLVRCMSTRLSSNTKLLEVALEKHKRLNNLLAQYNAALRKRSEDNEDFARPADKEAFLIKFLVDWELKENLDPTWRFSPQGINAIREDFVLLADYEDGEHMKDLDSEIRHWGSFLLEGPDRIEYQQLSGEEATAYLKKHTNQNFRSVWHFLVSVCRALQLGENKLIPYDAYWLGLIDEIPGSDLSTLRDIFESAPLRAPNPKRLSRSKTKAASKALPKKIAKRQK